MELLKGFALVFILARDEGECGEELRTKGVSKSVGPTRARGVVNLARGSMARRLGQDKGFGKA